MLTKRPLRLVAGTALPASGIVKAEQLERHRQGIEVLEVARRQADELLRQAGRQADAERLAAVERAEGQFWRQADALLHGWRRQREEMEGWFAAQAAQLLYEALSRLLQDAPPAERHAALLRQLLRAHGGEGVGTLYCHPSQRPEVADWLAAHPHLDWPLRDDADLPPDAVKLSTPHGLMTLSWRRAVEQLLPLGAVGEAVSVE